MQLIRLTREQWPRWKRWVRRFVRTYKDKHITPETSANLKALTRDDIDKPGTIALVAVENKRIMGVLIGGGYGHDFSLAVVRRGERSRGLGKQLLRRAIEELGSFHVEIASDNVPSLKIAFSCGLLAYGVFVRDNGKVVLRLKTYKGLA